MKELHGMNIYELHITVSYIAGGETYNNYRKEYFSAESEEEAIRIAKESLKEEDCGYTRIDVEEIYEVA